MIILSHTETYEDCPNKCKGLSYLHDNQEEKTCGICGTKWNRIDNKIITKNSKIEIGKTYTLRNGLKTSEIKPSNNGTKYIFQAEVKEPEYLNNSIFSWTATGRYLANSIDNRFDIIF